MFHRYLHALWRMTGLASPSGPRGPGIDYVRLVTVAMIPAIALLNALVPSDVVLNSLLVTPPALAAASWSAMGTGAVGLASLAVDMALSGYQGDLGTRATWVTACVIVVVTLTAMYVSRVRQQREATLAAVRSVAEAAQQALLRPLPHRLGPFRLEGMYIAAAAQARIGGDLYEAMHTPYGVRVLIGDVRGKGLTAVQVAAVLMESFREAAAEAPDLPALATRLEASVQRHSAQTPGTDAQERFATALLMEIPEDEPVVHMLSCGHPPALLLSSGTIKVLDPTVPSPPLNLGPLGPGGHEVGTAAFHTGDTLLLYTDGVSEGRDRQGVFYPLVERLEPYANAAPTDLIDHLRTDLLAHTAGTLVDDAAALVIRRTATHSPN